VNLQEKLEQKIKEVIRIFPWYENLIQGKSISSLQDLPLMTTSILEQHYYNQIADTSLKVYQTSGTSSKVRKRIFYSEEDDRRYVDLKTGIYANFIKHSAIKKALATVGTGHAASTASLIFERLQLENETVSYALPVEQHIERLIQFKPELLYTMPSILDRILYAAENPLLFGVKKIILVGEIATEQWIKRIAERFEIPVEHIMDTYGSIELGTLAYYSHEHKRYIVVDEMLAEGIQPREAGIDMDLGDSESIPVLTSFIRSMFPALRFVTYDVVRDLKPVWINGQQRQSFQNIVKRVGPELKHGEKISIYDIEEVVYKHLDEASIRVKVNNNRLTVYIKSKSINESLRTTIQREIQDQIEEIGTMIKNGILDEIEVIAAPDELLKNTGIKNKKLY
jgi:phenylacetate-coenzyme A ligase PaaK-like adenylate-forming protein